MVRVKRGVVSRRKHNKVLKAVKGFRLSRSKLIKRAREALVRSFEHAFQGRKERKRDFRQLWVTRISEAAKREGISYGKLINLLKQNKIELDRKVLADLVVNDPDTFKQIVAKVALVGSKLNGYT